MFSWSEHQSNPSNQKEIGRRLCGKTGGWWYGWRRRRRWITNMIQSEEIRSISGRACSRSISTITHPPLIWLWFMFQLHTVGGGGGGGLALVYLWTMDYSASDYIWLILDNSRRLLVRCVVRPAVWRVCPLPGLTCCKCVFWLPMLAMADLPALGPGN